MLVNTVTAGGQVTPSIVLDRDGDESIIGTFRELATSETKVGSYLRRFGCQVGFLAGPIEAAIQQARAAGKTVSVNSDLAGKIAFMLTPSAETCDCLFEKLAEGHGEEYVVDPAFRDEAGKITQELLLSGQCPDPFAQFNAENQ